MNERTHSSAEQAVSGRKVVPPVKLTGRIASEPKARLQKNRYSVHRTLVNAAAKNNTQKIARTTITDPFRGAYARHMIPLYPSGWRRQCVMRTDHPT